MSSKCLSLSGHLSTIIIHNIPQYLYVGDTTRRVEKSKLETVPFGDFFNELNVRVSINISLGMFTSGLQIAFPVENVLCPKFLKPETFTARTATS